MFSKILTLAALLFLVPTALAQCQIAGVDSWLWPYQLTVLDTDRGEIFRSSTSNILSIQSSQHSGDVLNGGPYFTATLEDSDFVLSLSDAFAEYEELEYTSSMNIQVVFDCSSGSTPATLIISITVQDTNNNAPRFVPTDSFTFNILPPIVPGYELTGCHGDLVVRDIDLTTQSVVFFIEDNPYFEIAYGGRDPTDSKNFLATLRAVSVLRSLPEPLVLQISAQDVDLTGDPPLTSLATVTIAADAEFELPAEPVFGSAYYTASYGADHAFSHQDIALSQGYDDQVVFGLSGDFADYFSLLSQGNSITIQVSEQLTTNILQENRRILLAVEATREFTSGATATLVVELPQAPTLRFEEDVYAGSLEDNSLQIDAIILSEGYQEEVMFILSGEYSTAFSLSNQENVITLSIETPLPSEAIAANSFISLSLEASINSAVFAQTVIILDIIKEDTLIPVFNEIIYEATYLESHEINLGSVIMLSQGYDETVTFNTEGDYAIYFDLVAVGNSITIEVVVQLPLNVLEQNTKIILPITASKPETVGANTVVSISLPQVRELSFNEDAYSGTLQGSDVSLPAVTLTEGFQENVVFSLSGDYSIYFELSNVNNIVIVEVESPIPAEILDENDFIILSVEASGPSARSTKTVLALHIIKDEIATPVFNQFIYTAIYSETGPIVEDISLSQGYDESVTFVLQGEYSQYFSVQSDINSVSIIVDTPLLPEALAAQTRLVLSLIANKPGTVGASTAIVVQLPEAQILRFSETSYVGSIQENIIALAPIALSDGYSDDVVFALNGDYADNFNLLNINNIVTIELLNDLPTEIIIGNNIIILELEASSSTASAASSTHTVIVLEVINNENVVLPIFTETYYSGSYTIADGLNFQTEVRLAQGYDDTVTFALSGDWVELFSIESLGDTVTLLVPETIPADIIANTHHIIFSIIANKPGTDGASSAISILLPDDLSTAIILQFEQISYIGSLEDEILQLDPIVLTTNYEENIIFNIEGELASYFAVSNENNVVSVQLLGSLPQEQIFGRSVIVLELSASSPGAITGHATIVLEIVMDTNTTISPVFSETFYTGSYTTENGLDFSSEITLIQGYDDSVTFTLSGDQATWFSIQSTESVVSLSVSQSIPAEVIAANYYLIFSIHATKPGTTAASAALSISLPEDLSIISSLRFEQSSYVGSLQDEILQLDSIILSAGYQNDVMFSLEGEFSSYFTISNIANVITVELLNPLPQEVIVGNSLIVMELIASSPDLISGYTIIVLRIITEIVAESEVLEFNEPFYTGSYTILDGLNFSNEIILVQGYDNTVIFTLSGDNAEWFSIQSNENIVSLSLEQTIPTELVGLNSFFIFSIQAEKPNTSGAAAAILISLSDGSIETGIFFDQALYSGVLEQGVVNHEDIFVYGYDETEIQLIGDYASEFEGAVSSSGQVRVVARGAGAGAVPAELAYVGLVLQADVARTALVLTVAHTETTEPPAVSFDSSSYVIRTDVSQSGLLGRVSAAADNAETVVYSLQLADSHLEERLSVSNDGELWLSSPANSGIYQFEVRATTIASQVTAEAMVYLTVDSVMVCGTDDRVLQPLIVLERDEEEPHDDLVVLNEDLAGNCSYEFTHRWPLDRDWLYINEQGHLSARAVDREDTAIAYMALSQIQVELVLVCSEEDFETQMSSRKKRNLGPYDYGTSSWILTEGIAYNSRRSFVNIIINDINDNSPIFTDKEIEPIVIGYPVADLLESITPSDLITLQATDADIGLNAQLAYWTSAPELVVSSKAGSVYVRDNYARSLQSGEVFTVSATDLDGAAGGLTGTIDIMVRLLEVNNIAVLTVRNALMENEKGILQQLSDAVQYEIKSLRTVVVSQEYEEEEESTFYGGSGRKELPVNVIHPTRIKRQAEVNEAGASLRIFIYGLMNTEPIDVVQLTSDIENANLSEVWGVSYQVQDLEQHLVERNPVYVPSGRNNNTGLLVSTIILSVMLILLIIFMAGWYLVQRKTERNYEQFTDSISRESSVTIDPLPKLEDQTRPRVNIEEIKRSEQRLQVMLEQSVPPSNVSESASTQPQLKTISEQPPLKSVTFDTIQELKSDRPLVIQSIGKLKSDVDSDDDDEFGERPGARRRKSVVTFNEQVEKIIHVDNLDNEDDDDEKNLQVFRF